MAKRCSYRYPDHMQCSRNCYGEYCVQHKPRKPIRKKGKQTFKYEEWRDSVARPYLIEKFGAVCADCGGKRCGNRQLDVDHIKNRGSHFHLRMSLTNVQLLGRYPCHYEKTNHINEKNR